jgi:glycerate-2-kinase
MRDDALEIFYAAVNAVQPSVLLPQHISVEGDIIILHGKSFDLKECTGIYVIGAGKAGAAMALEAEKILGDRITGGVIVTKYGHALPLKKIKCIEAGHPVPDGNSVRAGTEILNLVNGCGERDIILALVSGGASALMADHPPGTSLHDVQQLSALLLQCGAAIEEMNAVRKHLSFIKGGGLSRAAYPATIVSLILSDVIGDPLHVIASGPTVPDPSTFEEAHAVLEKYGLVKKIPPSLYTWITKGCLNEIEETPAPGDPVFQKTFNHLVGTNRIALQAAAQKAVSLGYTPLIITDKMQGEAKVEAQKFIRAIVQNEYSIQKRACLLMGGETTVTIRGSGKGGRNQEFALAALMELMNSPRAAMPLILSAGTDGSDGPTEATGALVDGETITFLTNTGIDPVPYLEANDSFHFFQKAGGHIITGPTQTNVMDIVMALIP